VRTRNPPIGPGTLSRRFSTSTHRTQFFEKKRIKARLKALIENGALKEAVRKDAKRKDRIFIEVGKWAT
jgi:hypothetical protein